MNVIFSDDPHGMNWLRPDFPYAEVRFSRVVGGVAPDFADHLKSNVETMVRGDEIDTVVTLTNVGDKPLFAGVGDVGVTLPLEDRYDLGAEQVEQRCNVHLFCAGTSSYVVALRMGGEPPHLGLVLTSGALESYSIERNLDESSNDRGCFVVNIAPFELAPGEQLTLAWTIFPFSDLADFYRQAGERARFLKVDWNRYVLFPGELAELTVEPSFRPTTLAVNGQPLVPDSDGRYRLAFEPASVQPGPDELGERVFDIDADGATVRTRILIKVPLPELVEQRCRFIAQHQQYRGLIAGLSGAFLPYDNEDGRIFYSWTNDFNAGRERVGMGLLLTQYLIALRDGVVNARYDDTTAILSNALQTYVEFVRRELIDPESGDVFNDFGRDASYERLYNAPWYASFFVKRYELDRDVENLTLATRIVEQYYRDGGASFYPLELPIVALCTALGDAGMSAELQAVTALFNRHADNLVRIGRAYPPAEVNYEQSIVAPAVDVLLQTSLISDRPDLVVAAQTHLAALLQFQGMQPDYQLHEVSIRHWDGFWFGKRALFGDTFPHHWSALSGNVFALMHRLTGAPEWAQRARASFRGVLPMIFDDGTASCAFVFPYAVNDRPAHAFDPYANDQDWALYFALRYVVANGDIAAL